MISKRSDEWREKTQRIVQVINPQTKELLDTLYRETLSRTYVNAEGNRIILAMAYATEGLLVFKPNTDDMREAPSLDIIKGVVARRGAVIAYDPLATDNARLAIGNPPGVSLATTAMDAVRGVDAPVIATEWKEFRSPDFLAIKVALKTAVIFDRRNLYEPSE